jgi:hypothetical protein
VLVRCVADQSCPAGTSDAVKKGMFGRVSVLAIPCRPGESRVGQVHSGGKLAWWGGAEVNTLMRAVMAMQSFLTNYIFAYFVWEVSAFLSPLSISLLSLHFHFSVPCYAFTSVCTALVSLGC